MLSCFSLLDGLQNPTATSLEPECLLMISTTNGNDNLFVGGVAIVIDLKFGFGSADDWSNQKWTASSLFHQFIPLSKREQFGIISSFVSCSSNKQPLWGATLEHPARIRTAQHRPRR